LWNKVIRFVLFLRGSGYYYTGLAAFRANRLTPMKTVVALTTAPFSPGDINVGRGFPFWPSILRLPLALKGAKNRVRIATIE